MKRTIRPWAKVGKTLVQETGFFKLFSQRMRHPSNGYEDDFFMVEFVDWVNIIPITSSGEVVLIDQYRFGVLLPSLEIPGGMLDQDEQDPERGALRELEEETGYTSDRIELLTIIHPNPALQNNRCFLYVAHDARPVGKQKLEPAEDIDLHLVPLVRVPELILSGSITHSLVVSAFCAYFARMTEGFSKPLFPREEL